MIASSSTRHAEPDVEPPQSRVVSAAVALFAEHGYAATSIRQIARSAGVSLDTIYARGGKAGVFLAAMERVLSGSPDETPLLDGPGMDQVWQAPTLEGVVSGLVEVTVRSVQRSARMWTAFVEGSSSDESLAAALAAKNDAMRGEGRRAVAFLKDRGLCAADVDTARVADLIWAHAHPNRFALLVGLAGWSVEQFRDELAATTLSLLRAERPTTHARRLA